ncbi:hypothetical protein B1A_16315 [mine drainage metagenome]|jgi:predicted CopG family antitoxin|uniref:Antitoxin n=1 Tax=mine drainage metagenome TaxID=410659 RepID=T1AIN3_9ZZZZ|nr:antitoxin VapB family protein [Candidatus Thermoplasmatota archaeon]MCL5987602.1 antitoxin VapB family protein [Candidatus Thermoplasmatota archaeon]
MVKVISIQDDVYEELSKRKDNKSFSSVIRELLRESNKNLTIRDLVKGDAILSGEEADKMKQEILDARKRSKSRNIKEM